MLQLAKTSEKEKEKSKASAVTATNLTTLEQVCGSDKETYQALSYMFLDPRKVDVSTKQAVDNAKKAEKEKDITSARMWYEVAGGLAIYEGDTKKVVEYYGGAERVTGEKYLIVNNPDKAVAKAQEYYKQYLHS
jgi:hypothetical protein